MFTSYVNYTRRFLFAVTVTSGNVVVRLNRLADTFTSGNEAIFCNLSS